MQRHHNQEVAEEEISVCVYMNVMCDPRERM